MSDVAQCRELAISAETNIEAAFNQVLDTLHSLNTRLIELHDEIRAVQPVASGAVCLELYACGKQCSGCPHSRWVQYKWTAPKDGKEGFLMGVNLDALQKEPVLQVPRKSAHFHDTVARIREAKSILAERSKLLSSVRNLRNILKI